MKIRIIFFQQHFYYISTTFLLHFYYISTTTTFVLATRTKNTYTFLGALMSWKAPLNSSWVGKEFLCLGVR